MNPDQKEFLVEELKGLREKVNVAVRDARQLERYSLVLTGGVWAWLLTHAAGLPRVSWWIPFFLSCLMMLREGVLYLEIRDLAKYIRGVEERFLGDEGGWEKHVHASKTFTKKQFRVPGAAIAFWSVLIAGTLLGPFWLTTH
jgi:hypothetical protein